MKTKAIFRSLSIGIVLLWNVTTWAQQSPINYSLPKITPVSPEAAALRKYVDYPVDYVSGLVPIDIPLFEIKDGDIVLPITLSYHASGLKVKEYSGWVGNGWTLNAEPFITRTVNGIKDEASSNSKVGFLCHYHSNPYSYENRLRAAKGELDYESDTYYFKLAGKNGKFYFVKRGDNYQTYFQVVNYPFGKEKMNYFDNSLSNFIMQDENGICYFFGNKAKETNGHRDPRIGTVTRWMGDSIVSAFTGARIGFEYVDKPVRTLSWDMTDKVTVTTDLSSYATEHWMKEYRDGTCTTYRINQDGSKDWISTMGYYFGESGFASEINYECYLKKIIFAQGTMVFTTDANLNLQYVDIFDKTGQLIKKIQFFITKYNPYTEHTKLDSLHIIDSENQPVERYRFQYYDINRVPAMSSRSIDHWGYFNGMNNSQGVLVPHGTLFERWGGTGPYITYEIGAGKRNSNDNMRVGILEYIYWPEGRRTQFEFEPNQYWWHSGIDGPQSVSVGGLRIKRIDEKDLSNSKNSYRVFDYKDCGAIKSKPHLDLSNYSYCQEIWEKAPYNSIVKREVRTWNSASLVNQVFSSGAPMRYVEVEEFRYGGNVSEGKWKSVYIYKFNNSIIEKDVCSPFAVDYENDWSWGQLECEKHYALDEYNTPRHLSTKTITYTSISTPPISKRKVFFKTILDPFDDLAFTDADRNASIADESYIFAGGKMLPNKETYEEYLTNGSIKTEKTFQYRQFPTEKHHVNPVQITTTSSTGNIIEDFVYPEDVPYSNAYYENFGEVDLIRNNTFNLLLAYDRTESGVTQSTRRIYSGGRPSVVKTNTGPSGEFENKLYYHRYNSYSKPACVSYEGGPYTVYIWGYNNQYLLAAIENASYDDVEQLMGGSAAIDSIGRRSIPLPGEIAMINNLRSSRPEAMVTTYTYKPLVGITSETDPSGRTIFYEYDSFGRLMRIKDENGKIIEDYKYNYAGQ